MDFLTALGLFVVASAVAGVLFGAFVNASFARFVAAGAVLVVALWVVWAIAIYRGPDNPDLGEFGFTVLAAFICMLLLAAWVGGLAVGRVLRRSREAGTRT